MERKDSHTKSCITDCKIIDLQVFPDVNGKLAVIENGNKLPFVMKRMFFLYDVPSGAQRGGHSHYEEEQLIIAATGSFEVIIYDGINTTSFTLNKPNQGLYIPPGLWRELKNFTSGAVSLVISSTNFNENDYVRDYDEFLTLTSEKSCTKK